jgi:hypothetical protein
MPPRDDGGPVRGLDTAALDRLWDAMNRQIAPVGGRTASPSLDAADTIGRLIDRDDAPHLAAREIDLVWASIAAVTLPEMAVVADSSPVAGRTSDQTPTATTGVIGLLRNVARQIAIGALAGFLVGLVVIGGGLRLFMRLAAILTEGGANQMVTENGNTAGQITLDGTLSILIFSGGMFGVVGGIVVMAVRPWLPASGWRRSLLAGGIGFAVAGPAVLEGGENGDYKRFGILGINVCLFTLLPFLFGIAVLPVIDWLDRAISPALPGLSRGWRDLLKSILLAPLVLMAVLLLPLALMMPPVALLLALPIVRVVAPIWLRRAATRDQRRQRERWEVRFARVMLVTPCLLGLVLMAQALNRLTG